MNRCFLIGNVIEIGKFKFILNEKYKSKITMKIKTLDKNVITIMAYDDMADYILRNKYLNTTVLIQGRVKNVQKGICVIAYHIEQIFKNEKMKGVV